MAFRSANLSAHMLTFNSATSAHFLEMYESILDDEICAKSEQGPAHRTFAPSSMRCDRISWFRLRGVQPDKINNPDRTLNFTAQVGTACHEAIQKRLSEKLGADWIDVQTWIDQHFEFFSDYEMTLEKAGYESRIELTKPFPVRFGCDGILRFEDKVFLLEIKTAEFSSLQDLIEPKPEHIDQIKCYSTLLHINDVLFVYQDRQYGELKCFQIEVTELDQLKLRERMQRVMDLVEANIAPEGLPVGDAHCSQNMCPYWKKCKEWGR